MQFLHFNKGIWFLVCCISLMPAQSIEQTEIERLAGTLASDAMEGRKAGSPGIQKAADFIAAEFEKAGLSQWEGVSDYRQKFEVYEVVPGNRILNINGIPMGNDRLIAGTDRRSYLSETMKDFTVLHIGAEDQPFQKVREYGQLQGRLLILVDPTHEAFFQRLKRWLSQRIRLKLETEKETFIALTSIKKIEKLYLHVSNKVQKLEFQNIVGVLPGKTLSKEIVLFGAHYDHLGSLTPVAGDSIANGADDNASGTTAVVALANYFKARNDNERTLVFIAFTAEEMGGYGSRQFAKQIDPARVVAMINIEMIGKPSKFGPGTGYITGFDRSDLGTILSQNLADKLYGFHPDPYPSQNLFNRSDNAVFARLGIPAHSISSVQMDRDKYYHTVDDELETLDFQHMSTLIQAIAESCRTLVSGEATPSRIALDGSR